MKILKLAFLLLAPLTALGQNLSTSGNITQQVSACSLGSGSGSVYYALPTNAASVALALSGTWSSTVQFVGSVNGTVWSSLAATPVAGGSAVTSTTANGTWSLAMGGLAYVCAYASTYSSGTIAVAMSTTTGAVSAQGVFPSAVPAAVASGGTNATTAAAALANLGALPLAGGTETGPLYLTQGLANSLNFNVPGDTSEWLMYQIGTGANATFVLDHSGVATALHFDAPGNTIIQQHLNQAAAGRIGGSCAMSAGTSCTFSLAAAFTTPICIATQQSATLTGGAVGCTVSGTTVTITAAVANSETWGALVFGNPN